MEKRLINYEDLTKSEKIDHIWEYYKFHIIVILSALWFVYWILNHYVFNPPPEVTLDVSIFGEFSQTEVIDELEVSLQDIIVKDGENEEVFVDFFSVVENQDYNIQQATITKMMAKATLNDFDIMIFEGDYFQTFLQEDSLLSLNELVKSGIINVDFKLLKKGNEVDYAKDGFYLVDISENKGFKRMLETDQKIYLGIYTTTEQIEHIQEAIDYILNKFK